MTDEERPARRAVAVDIPVGETSAETERRVSVIAKRLIDASHAALIAEAKDEASRHIGAAIANWWQGDYHASRGEFQTAAMVYHTGLQDFLRMAITVLGQARVAEWERLAAACIEGYNREAEIIDAEQEKKHGNSSVH